MVKIERSYPAPKSLVTESEKITGSYSKPDVIERLRKDFHDKCYICELKGLQDPEVEHLLPHKNGRHQARKFDWDNLFWSCGHCNNVKNQAIYEGRILDCCKKDPEESINFELNEDDVCIFAKDSDDREAALTAKLVKEVFNVCNTGMRVYRSDYRLKKLQEEMNVLYTKLEDYRKKPGSKVTQRTLKALLRRETAFAGFKRCYIREHLEEYPELTEYIA